MFSKFNPKKIAFALITYYPKWHKGKLRSISNTHKIRGDLALEFIKKASGLGYQLVVVDGRSSRSFRLELKNFPDIKLVKRRGYKRSPAKRQAFINASGLPEVKVIIASEPEKISLIDSVQTISQPILDGDADIVIPKRKQKLFEETYPDYMYQSETEGNFIYNRLLKSHKLLKKDGEDLDAMFGPRVLSNTPKVLSLFLKKYPLSFSQTNSDFFDPEEYSNAQFFPIVYALKKKLRIVGVEIPFVYPKLQKENETRGQRILFEEKRKAQKLGILLELMHLLSYFKK